MRCGVNRNVLSPRRTPNWGSPGGENMGHPPHMGGPSHVWGGIPHFFPTETAMLCMVRFLRGKGTKDCRS